MAEPIGQVNPTNEPGNACNGGGLGGEKVKIFASIPYLRVTSQAQSISHSPLVFYY